MKIIVSGASPETRKAFIGVKLVLLSPKAHGGRCVSSHDTTKPFDHGSNYLGRCDGSRKTDFARLVDRYLEQIDICGSAFLT
jgi:hypothetical protein